MARASVPRALILLGLSVAVHSPASAGTPVDEICKGLRVRVQPQPLTLRSAPQEKFLIFYGVGTQVGMVSTYAELTVEDVLPVRTVFRHEKWIQVTYEGRSGWVYVGNVGDKDSCCVERLPDSKCR